MGVRVYIGGVRGARSASRGRRRERRAPARGGDDAIGGGVARVRLDVDDGVDGGGDDEGGAGWADDEDDDDDDDADEDADADADADEDEGGRGEASVRGGGDDG